MTKQDYQCILPNSVVNKPKKRGRKKMDEGERKVRRLQQNRVSALKCRQKKKEQYERLIEEKDELLLKTQQMELKIQQLTLQYEKERSQNESLLERVATLESLQKGSLDSHSTLDSKFSNENEVSRPSLLSAFPINSPGIQNLCGSPAIQNGQ